MNKIKKGGVNLKFIGICSVAIAIVISALMVFFMIRSNSVFNDMNAATEKYISLQNDVAMLKAGSDYLTEQVRLFVVTGIREYMDNYFEELNMTKRRDKALDDVSLYISERTEEYGYFKLARELSDELVKIEYRALRMALEGYEYEPSDYPDELAAYIFDAGEEDDITPQNKRSIAISAVFGREYQRYKGRIYYNTEKCFNMISRDNREALDANRERLSMILRVETVFLILLFMVVVFVVLMTVTLIINPLKRSMKLISEGKDIAEGGSEEMRAFAQSYNRVAESNEKKRKRLAYEAMHDALTGLFNRASFIKHKNRSEWGNVAVIALDIDRFKEINDENGHTSGDLALKRFADVIRATFRSEDYIARIGGDEFIIVMLNSGPEHVPLIKAKLESAKKTLAVGEGDVPPIHFSAGIAFGNWSGKAEEICEDADRALYRVKENGKDGYAFF